MFPLRAQKVDFQTTALRAAPIGLAGAVISYSYYLCKNVIQTRCRGNASLCVWLLEAFAMLPAGAPRIWRRLLLGGGRVYPISVFLGRHRYAAKAQLMSLGFSVV